MPTSPQISKSVGQMSRRKASRLLFALLPSFIQPFLTQTPNKPNQIHPTSWVDGMRGVASFIVFICHTASPFHDRQDWGYGTVEPDATDNKNNLWLAQLPIIKLLYSGGPMVNLFFVISGLALSYKPVRLLRDHEWDRLFQTMTSATFRRWIRITCPMIASTFMAFSLNRLYVYEFFRPYNSGLPYRFPAFSTQLWNWMAQTGHQMDFLYGPNERVFNEYGPQTWTISLELKGSFVLFLLIIALCRARIHIRFLVLLTLCWHCVMRGYWEYFCFISGMILTELDFIRQASESESAKEEVVSKRLSKKLLISNSKWIVIFLFSLFLMSGPNKYPNLCPGYQILDRFNPLPNEHPRFWPIIGAILCVWSVGNCIPLQSLFTNRFSQYLGQISYSLYLTHGIITDTIDFYVIKKAWAFTGVDTVFRYELGWSLMFVFSLPVAFWVADLFWRGVDVRSVVLSRWVERKFCYS